MKTIGAIKLFGVPATAVALIALVLATVSLSEAQDQSASQARAGEALPSAAQLGKQEYRDELDKSMLQAYEGDREAQFKVGVLFSSDKFGNPDYEQAAYWYKQAALQGHLLAQYNLGHQHLIGLGVEKSDESAMQWWLEAAKNDHALAQFNVGRAYYLGIGLQEDHSQSRYWFERAADNNEPKSIEILQQLGWDTGARAPAPSFADAGNSAVNSVANAPSSEASSGASTPATSPSSNSLNQSVDQSAVGQDWQLTSKVVPLNDVDAQAGTTISEQAPANQNQASGITNDATQSTASVAAVEPAITPEPATVTAPTAEEDESNITLYTNPSPRSVLIAVVRPKESLSKVSSKGEWTSVKSSTGFPVWVSGDFVRVDGDTGTLTGNSVNARSVPIITTGTVVDKFNKGETVRIISSRDGWHRVVAPARFVAWVKSSDLNGDTVTVKLADNAITVPSTSNNLPDSNIIEKVTAAPIRSDRSSNSNRNGYDNNNAWMYGQPTNHYTLQLASFDDADKVREFESKPLFKDNENLRRFSARGKNIDWIYFLYGTYPDRESAEAAKSQIGQKRAWIRTFGRLQQNRCVAWKTQFPTPAELNRYCTQ